MESSLKANIFKYWKNKGEKWKQMSDMLKKKKNQEKTLCAMFRPTNTRRVDFSSTAQWMANNLWLHATAQPPEYSCVEEADVPAYNRSKKLA